MDFKREIFSGFFKNLDGESCMNEKFHIWFWCIELWIYDKHICWVQPQYDRNILDFRASHEYKILNEIEYYIQPQYAYSYSNFTAFHNYRMRMVSLLSYWIHAALEYVCLCFTEFSVHENLKWFRLL